jgi:hypothetical protein
MAKQDTIPIQIIQTRTVVLLSNGGGRKTKHVPIQIIQTRTVVLLSNGENSRAGDIWFIASLPATTGPFKAAPLVLGE